MADFETYRAGYEKNWAGLKIRPERQNEANREAARILGGKPRYAAVEERTGVPWWFVGLCHYRESHFNFATYLGNGQPLNRKTTIVPKDRGPFQTFEDGAVDALQFQGFVGLKDWSIERVCYRLEGFNGYGYHDPYVRGTKQKLGRAVPSPYLYGGSTVYEKGKYTRDHYFDPNFVDTQLGTLVILKALLALDATIRFPADNITAMPMQQEAPAIPSPPDVEPVPSKPGPPPAPPGVWSTFWKNFTKRG